MGGTHPGDCLARLALLQPRLLEPRESSGGFLGPCLCLWFLGPGSERRLSAVPSGPATAGQGPPRPSAQHPPRPGCLPEAMMGWWPDTASCLAGRPLPQGCPRAAGHGFRATVPRPRGRAGTQPVRVRVPCGSRDALGAHSLWAPCLSLQASAALSRAGASRHVGPRMRFRRRVYKHRGQERAPGSGWGPPCWGRGPSGRPTTWAWRLCRAFVPFPGCGRPHGETVAEVPWQEGKPNRAGGPQPAPETAGRPRRAGLLHGGASSEVAWGMFAVGTRGKRWLEESGAAGTEAWDVRPRPVSPPAHTDPATSTLSMGPGTLRTGPLPAGRKGSPVPTPFPRLSLCVPQPPLFQAVHVLFIWGDRTPSSEYVGSPHPTLPGTGIVLLLPGLHSPSAESVCLSVSLDFWGM